MAGATTPDGISYLQTGDLTGRAAESANQASSIQTALNFRQRYEFVWANSTARTAQAGMVEGSTGYQIDTKTEYLYTSSAWRPRTSYGEFSSAAVTLVGTSYTAFNTISVVTANTTDASNFTTSANTITLTQAGIYSVSWFWTATPAPGTADAFGVIGIASDYQTNVASQIARGVFTYDPTSSGSVTRNLPAGTVLYFAWKQSDATSRQYALYALTIARLG